MVLYKYRRQRYCDTEEQFTLEYIYLFNLICDFAKLKNTYVRFQSAHHQQMIRLLVFKSPFFRGLPPSRYRYLSDSIEGSLSKISYVHM